MKRYYVGMDVGSTYIKAALLQNDQVMDVQLRPTGIDPEKTVAELLETSVEEIPSLVQRSTAPCQINSTCAVFTQTKVISLLAQKKDRSDILAGMHIAMANRIAKMARKYKSAGDVLMTGGGANMELFGK